MKSFSVLTATFGLVLVGLANDALTGLPLYPGAGTSNPKPDYKLCQSTHVGVAYNPANAKMDAVMPWYTKQLAGYKRYHLDDTTHASSDTFFSPDGKLEVTLTGSKTDPNAVFAISYGRFTPALSAVEMKTYYTGQRCN
jgi:hypothetical protein